MDVIFYSTHCPKCNILEKKMNIKNINYTIVTDENIMREKGFMSLPMLEVDGEYMDFGTAVKWVDAQGVN